jgi:hypothetical protein
MQEQRQWIRGRVTVYIPPIARCAMDGAPVDCSRVEKNRQRQKQMRGSSPFDLAQSLQQQEQLQRQMQKQMQMRGFFAPLRMTREEGRQERRQKQEQQLQLV